MDKIIKKIIGTGYEKRSGNIILPKHFLSAVGLKIDDNVVVECDYVNAQIIIKKKEAKNEV